jgi:hypothetical protein
MFKRIKKWFEDDVWNRGMVLDAVTKGKITEAEAREILGEE